MKAIICRGERLAPEFLKAQYDPFIHDYLMVWTSSSAQVFDYEEAEAILWQLHEDDEEEAYIVSLE